MRHLRSGRKLNRSASHRKAMLKNLAVSILDKERVTTTVTKAKEVRRVVERLITYGKKANLHGIRLAEKSVKNKTVLKKLFDDIAPGYKDREGGYTRVVRLNERKGDNAELAIIELVGREGDVKRTRKKKPAAKKTKTVQKSKPKTAEELKKSPSVEKKVEKVKTDKTTKKKSSVKPTEKPDKKVEKKEKSTKTAVKKEAKSAESKEKKTSDKKADKQVKKSTKATVDKDEKSKDSKKTKKSEKPAVKKDKKDDG